MTWDAFLIKAQAMGAIVEAFPEGDKKRPVQLRVNPFTYVAPISTHDQLLDGQVTSAAGFPPTKRIVSKFRSRQRKLPRYFPGAASWGVSPSISYRCGAASTGPIAASS
jgi:hypothetical protein